MPNTLPDGAASSRPDLLDIGRPKMAKANVQTPDIAPNWAAKVAKALTRAVAITGLSHKEAAALLPGDVDEAEFGKWLSGARRPHLDRILAVDRLRLPVIACLCAECGAEITTGIKFREPVIGIEAAS